MLDFLNDHKNIYIQQKKELTEILIDFETRNKYSILDENRSQLGFIAEEKKGLLDSFLRVLLRSHRPLDITVFNPKREKLIKLHRNFFFFFSDLMVQSLSGKKFGSVHRRFSFLYKKYDLIDPRGRLFARIKSPLWRLWTFPVYDNRGQQIAVITKKWSGLMQEAFTDSDTFMVETGPSYWSLEQKIVLFVAAISIDFDFFENNSKRGGALNFFD